MEWFSIMQGDGNGKRVDAFSSISAVLPFLPSPQFHTMHIIQVQLITVLTNKNSAHEVVMHKDANIEST